jgi:son of sevenless-like protein
VVGVSAPTDISQHLHGLNNFNTLMALLAGLRSGAVYRLAYTRAEMSRKCDKVRPPSFKPHYPLPQTLEALNNLMRGDNAYKTYREALARSAPPCIPYLYGRLVLMNIYTLAGACTCQI